MAERKFFVGGNFKMNGDQSSLEAIAANLNKVNSPNTGKSWFISCFVLKLWAT